MDRIKFLKHGNKRGGVPFRLEYSLFLFFILYVMVF